MPPLRVGVVPHTHWDREWYAPFQTFRVRLVGLLDELLDLLERDESYERFLLDGQTVVIDDYLEVRPEAAPRLAALASAGRLQVGPWMVLMDEYMVSGETMVRDLQHGIARATELGAVMDVGYLPDMFGHVAQMPQLLRLVGFEHAVVWRGVPAAIDRTAFWWDAPDGSRVRAEYLYGSYSNGRDLPKEATALVARARGYEAELGPARLPGGGMLLMNGTDHQLPQPWLGQVVADANAAQDEYRFSVTSLPEYLAGQPSPDDLAVWSTELRSGARANVLMGVASNRVDVHQVCAAAERALERRAEPLERAAAHPRPVPDAPARPRVAQPRAQQRARLVVRVQRRRGRRRRRRPLPGGAPDRRRARARCPHRPRDAQSTPSPARRSCGTRLAPIATGLVTAHRPRGGAGAPRRRRRHRVPDPGARHRRW